MLYRQINENMGVLQKDWREETWPSTDEGWTLLCNGRNPVKVRWMDNFGIADECFVSFVDVPKVHNIHIPNNAPRFRLTEIQLRSLGVIPEGVELQRRYNLY